MTGGLCMMRICAVVYCRCYYQSVITCESHQVFLFVVISELDAVALEIDLSSSVRASLLLILLRAELISSGHNEVLMCFPSV